MFDRLDVLMRLTPTGEWFVSLYRVLLSDTSQAWKRDIGALHFTDRHIWVLEELSPAVSIESTFTVVSEERARDLTVKYGWPCASRYLSNFPSISNEIKDA